MVTHKLPVVSVSTEMEGRELACAMLEEFEQLRGDDACALERRYHVGQPQRNTVLRYLDILRARNDRALDAGFGAVLSDALACAIKGRPSADLYRRIIKREPLQARPAQEDRHGH